MSRRLLAPALILGLLVVAVSLAFVNEDGEPTQGGTQPGPTPAPIPDGPFDEIAPRLRGLQGSEDDEVTARRLVDAALERLRGSPRARILQALAHDDWGTQWAGLLAIPRYGPSDADLAKRIEALLASDLAHIRRTAAEAAAYLAPADFGPVEVRLTSTARDPRASVRSAALRTLARRTADRVALVPLFEAALADEHGAMRTAGAYGLAQIELQERLAPEVVDRLRPALVRALKDPLTDVVVYAVMALGRAGPRAGPDVPAILSLCRDDRALVRGQAATALGSIGAPALPYIEEALATGATGRGISPLLWALRQMGEAGYPALLRALEHESGVIRAMAAQKLWEQQHEEERAIDALVAVLDLADVDAVRVAVRSLGRMDSQAARALPALRKLREHPDESLRAAVAAAIERLQPEDG